MTLSNFSRTDKQAQQWFILLPDGHEGPYSIVQLEQKLKDGLPSFCKVWREGDEESITLKALISSLSVAHAPVAPLPSLAQDDFPPDMPDLPPLPFDEEEQEIFQTAPSFPEIPVEVPVHLETSKTDYKKWIVVFIGVSVVLAAFVVFKDIFISPTKVSWTRPQKMSVANQRSLNEKLHFDSWDQPLFFYEATAPDYSKIWLVTPQFYACDINAQFTADEASLLSFDVKEVSFQGSGRLLNHVTELNSFQFEKGQKIIPGFYKMILSATRCEWEGWQAKLSNLGQSLPEKIDLSYRVAIFPQGATSLTEALQQLATEKYQREQRKKLASDHFWQDMQQKYQTLLAISLQVEQFFIDFLDSSKNWNPDVKLMVDKYTKNYGSLLTNFLVSNEEDFQQLRKEKAKNLSVKTGHENKIRMTAKNMGMHAMTLIEGWQKTKALSTKADRENMKKKVNLTFKNIKTDLNQKIIDITDEQAKLTE